ncbi:MAG: hypothetical protein EOP51_34930 [Sphingobacteriales bacterium]|nr:MAG: hypothetical protein EOP51_34930 [Sphingobacteriales bacterium]
MMTSAPFDDWWHNTYGLDVKVLSPPHILLIGGMVAIQLGSCICVSAANAFTLPNISAPKTYHVLFAIAAGSVISTIYFLFFNAFFLTSHTHNGNYYFYGALIFTGCLVMVSRASNYKWAATAAAGVYMAEYVIMLWLLPLFPASPLVGPVYNHFDHYQPLGFPLLLIFPAITIDIVINQVKHIAVWIKIPLAALLFLATFFVVQWCFGEFYLTSEYSRSWFFGSYSLGYYGDPDYKYRYAYDPWLVEAGKGLLKNLIYAGIAGTISAAVGYILGSWLKRVKR